MKETIGITIVLAALLTVFLWLTKDKADQGTVLEEDKSSQIEKTIEKRKPEKSLKDTIKVSKKTAPEKSKVVQSTEKCNDFRAKHPKEEAAFNELIGEIYMGLQDGDETSVFANMDWSSLQALANGGDKNALFFLGDGISIRAIFGTDFYGPKEQRLSPTPEEMKAHKVQLDKFQEGQALLFKSAILGKFGAFLNLKSVNEFAAMQLIRTEPESEALIRQKLASMLAYNRMSVFVHKNDEPLRVWFDRSANDYDYKQLRRHFKNWKPNLTEKEYSEELRKIQTLVEQQYKVYEDKWIKGREFDGLEIHPKLLSPELEAYLTQVFELCSQ